MARRCTAGGRGRSAHDPRDAADRRPRPPRAQRPLCRRGAEPSERPGPRAGCAPEAVGMMVQAATNASSNASGAEDRRVRECEASAAQPSARRRANRREDQRVRGARAADADAGSGDGAYAVSLSSTTRLRAPGAATSKSRCTALCTLGSLLAARTRRRTSQLARSAAALLSCTQHATSSSRASPSRSPNALSARWRRAGLRSASRSSIDSHS